MTPQWQGLRRPRTFHVTHFMETDGLRFLVMPPSLALWPMSRCSSARAGYEATVPKCRGAPPHQICGCLLERDLAKPRSLEERLGPSEIAAETGRRWGVSGRWQSPQVGRSGLSICLMPPSLSRYGSTVYQLRLRLQACAWGWLTVGQ